ncbi:MAG: hypothetical protein R3F62_04185 [Planctomycetota bacterium]
MSDEALRQAARGAAASDEAALAALLRQRQRLGELEPAALRRVAALGYAPAAHALDLPTPTGDLAERADAYLGASPLSDCVRLALCAARAAAPACDPADAAAVGRLLYALGDLLLDLDDGDAQDGVDDQLRRLDPATPLVMGQPAYPPDAPAARWALQAAFEAGRSTQHPQLFRVHAQCAVVFAARAVGEPTVEAALLRDVVSRHLNGRARF